jgi:hypothetical protein
MICDPMFHLCEVCVLFCVLLISYRRSREDG